MSGFSLRTCAVLAVLLGGLISGCRQAPINPKPHEATTQGEVAITNAVLVAADNGVATLAGTATNTARRPDSTVSIQARRGPHQLEVYASTGGVTMFPGKPAPLGDIGQAYVVRGVKPGQTVHLTIVCERAAPIPLDVPVVEFGPKYTNRLITFPGPPPTVTQGRIVVGPGGKRAYVGYTINGNGEAQHGSLEDVKAIDPSGRSIAWKHQTATGGPADIYAPEGSMTVVPETEVGGDADYVDAADVHVGETIQVAFEFPAGIVKVPFRVVAG
jgi:hypothetical protein